MLWKVNFVKILLTAARWLPVALSNQSGSLPESKNIPTDETKQFSVEGDGGAVNGKLTGVPRPAFETHPAVQRLLGRDRRLELPNLIEQLSDIVGVAIWPAEVGVFFA